MLAVSRWRQDDLSERIGGRKLFFPKGMSNQYVISMANRDPEVFHKPATFNPDRGNLGRALTWNGAFGAEDEGDYPRICPGRYLALDVAQAAQHLALTSFACVRVSVCLRSHFGSSRFGRSRRRHRPQLVHS